MTALPSRQAVVDALATIPGVSATLAMPDTPVAGAAWPVWTQSRQAPGKLAHPIAHTYDAVVLLPAGYHPDTVDAADGLIEQVIYALSKAGAVEPCEPVTVVFDPNQTTMPGIHARVTVSVC